MKSNLPSWLVEAAVTAARKEKDVPAVTDAPEPQKVSEDGESDLIEESGSACPEQRELLDAEDVGHKLEEVSAAGDCSSKLDDSAGLAVIKVEYGDVSVPENSSESDDESEFIPSSESETEDDDPCHVRPSNVTALQQSHDQQLFQPVVSMTRIFLPGSDGPLTQKRGRNDPIFDIYLKRTPRDNREQV